MIKQVDDVFLRVPTILVKQPLGTFYTAAIRAKDLLKVCYSDRLRAILEDDTYRLEGSQRLVNDTRLKEIGRYINTTEAAFPNSIIIAANYSEATGLIVNDETHKWRVEGNGDDTECLNLIIPTAERLAPIIDGQHRLFGFTHGTIERRDTPVLCSVFLDLPRPYQAYLFATINSTQKAVSRSQTYELFGYNIDEEPPELWSPEKLAVFLTRKMNTDSESPFYSRILVAAENDFAISRAEAKARNRWMVSTATVVDGIARLISTAPKKDADDLRTGRNQRRIDLIEKRRHDKAPLRKLYLETRDKVLLGAVTNFFRAVLTVCRRDRPVESYLTKTVGMQALFDTLRALASSAFKERNFSYDSFRNRLGPLSDIDFSHTAFQQASGQGRIQIRRVIFEHLGISQKVTDEQRAEIRKIIDSASLKL